MASFTRDGNAKPKIIILCERCDRKLRLPKSKKKMRVTCPSCGHRFEYRHTWWGILQASRRHALVGAVGGLVGMIGGLGGFILPISFGILLDVFHVWSVVFMLMFVIVAVSTIWMHVAIRKMDRERYPELRENTHLSDVPHA